MVTINKGLEGVIVDESAISLVDGNNGQLSYRGKSIDTLVSEPFENVANWVVNTKLNDHLTEPMKAARRLTPDESQRVLALPEAMHPMHVLLAAIPALARTEHFDESGEVSHGLTIAAKMPTVLATYKTRRTVTFDDGSDLIGGFLTAIAAPADARKAFEVTQILQLEHSFNASTFAARVAASTLSPIENCIAAAVATLHGILHGGADQAALEAADRVGNASQAEQFVDDCLKRGEKIMGMGHREYRVFDPRARFVKSLAKEATDNTPHAETYATLTAIEDHFAQRMLEKGKEVHANLEFYKGLVYRCCGLTPDYFTAAFAMARVFGYIAHVQEQWADNRIIRPAAHYVGPPVTPA